MSAVLVARDGRIGRVTLNRPEARNAITVELATGLEAAVRELAVDSDVIVIRGAGGTFCAGGDVAEVDRLRQQGRGALATLFTAFRGALAAIAEVPVPVVAAVEGHAVAGGFELVQAVDVTVARIDARLADIHARFGQVPGGGSTQRLSRIVGTTRALGLILTGDTLSGADAERWGLVYRAAAPDDFEPTLDAVVASLLRGSRATRAASKRLIRAGRDVGLDEGLDAELEAVLDHLGSSTGDDAVTAFTERERTP